MICFINILMMQKRPRKCVFHHYNVVQYYLECQCRKYSDTLVDFHFRNEVYGQISTLFIFQDGGTISSTNLEFSRNNINKNLERIDTFLHDCCKKCFKLKDHFSQALFSLALFLYNIIHVYFLLPGQRHIDIEYFYSNKKLRQIIY